MLTKELLKFRRSGGFKPVFINPAEPERQKLASELIGVYQGAFDSRMGRGEIEELTDVLIKGARDQIFASGLNKLLLDHTDFDPVREIDYPALRGELFAFASEKLVEAQGDVARYRELLATRPGLIEFMAGDIYGDLPDNERISAAPKLTATELLNRYNLAQVQGLLIYAESIELEVRDEHPAELRRLFKYLKFFRLLAEIRRKGRGKSVAYELSISGPFSLFANTRKYALQLAAFFPAVVNLAQWKLKAKIRLGKLSGAGFALPEFFQLRSGRDQDVSFAVQKGCGELADYRRVAVHRRRQTVGGVPGPQLRTGRGRRAGASGTVPPLA